METEATTVTENEAQTPDNTPALTAAQTRALSVLIVGGGKDVAAKEAGVSTSTIYRWLRDDELFKSELDSATRVALREFVAILGGLAAKAVQALNDALDSSQHISHRLRAADLVITHILNTREHVDLEERLAQLEQQLNGGSR